MYKHCRDMRYAVDHSKNLHAYCYLSLEENRATKSWLLDLIAVDSQINLHLDETRRKLPPFGIRDERVGS